MNSAGQTTGLAVVTICLVALAAYHNSFSGPFVFDDVFAVVENSSIRRLWPIGDVLSPPSDSGVTVNGRPLVNLSLAVNRALGGEAVAGYHGFNLVVHTFAALVLFGLVRRTLARLAAESRLGLEPTAGGLIIAALWVAHPLQTESVTYIVQRAESMVGLFYLLTLYCFVRAVEPLRAGWWSMAAASACLLGMATKEVMVSAPLLVLVYDRTFVAGTFAGAWRQRRPFHLALAATWLLLAGLMMSSGNRGGTAGFGYGISAWEYALTQCRAIGMYLRLMWWPGPLVFDYGTEVVRQAGQVAPQLVAGTLLLGGTAWALWRRPAVGFLGIAFLAILAPSSSVVPIITETMAEHRVYLALAVPIIFVVAGMSALMGRRSLAALGVAVVALAWLTVQRNLDYRTDLGLWADTVAKRPGNERAHQNLADILMTLDRVDEAIRHYDRALVIQPRFTNASLHLGNALLRAGRTEDALRRFEATLRIDPTCAEAHSNLGVLLFDLGKPDEGVRHLERAVALGPKFPSVHYNMGTVLFKLGRIEEAIQCFEGALRLKPAYAEAHNNLGSALVRAGRLGEARVHYVEALRLKPAYEEARGNLVALDRALEERAKAR